MVIDFKREASLWRIVRVLNADALFYIRRKSFLEFFFFSKIATSFIFKTL